MTEPDALDDPEDPLDYSSFEELQEFLNNAREGEKLGLHTSVFIKESKAPEDVVDQIWLTDYAQNIFPFDSMYWHTRAMLS